MLSGYKLLTSDRMISIDAGENRQPLNKGGKDKWQKFVLAKTNL